MIIKPSKTMWIYVFWLTVFAIPALFKPYGIAYFTGYFYFLVGMAYLITNIYGKDNYETDYEEGDFI